MDAIRTSPTGSPRRGAARLLVLLAVVAAGAGGLYLWSGGSSDGEAPRPPLPPAAAPQAAPAEPRAPAPLAEPGGIRDTRPFRTVEGRVVDGETEEPIGRFTIRHLRGPVPDDEEAWERAGELRIQSSQGRFGLGGLGAGVHALRFEAPGYAPRVLAGMEMTTRDEDDLVVRLERGSRIHGRIASAGGRGIPGLAVRLAPRGADGTAPRTTETDDGGAYLFGALPDGARWRVELAGLEGVLGETPASPVLAPEPGGETVWNETVPELTAVTLEVTTRPRNVFADYQAVLWNRTGTRIETVVRRGVARFPHVPPAHYELSIGKPGKEPWYTELVEVPQASEPVLWKRTIRLPERKPPPRGLPGEGGTRRRPGRR